MATYTEILPKVIKTVTEHFIGPLARPTKIVKSDTSISDFEPDDLDWIELVMAIEEDFGIEITDLEYQMWQDEDYDVDHITKSVVQKLEAKH